MQEKVKNFVFFLQKYLCMSKKSSTFARFFALMCEESPKLRKI